MASFIEPAKSAFFGFGRKFDAVFRNTTAASSVGKDILYSDKDTYDDCSESEFGSDPCQLVSDSWKQFTLQKYPTNTTLKHMDVHVGCSGMWEARREMRAEKRSCAVVFGYRVQIDKHESEVPVLETDEMQFSSRVMTFPPTMPHVINQFIAHLQNETVIDDAQDAVELPKMFTFIQYQYDDSDEEAEEDNKK